MLERIGEVGVGPDAVPLNPELRKAWRDDFAAARDGVAAAVNDRAERIKHCKSCDVVNGWIYPPADKGDFGTHYNLRAAVALAGLFANRPAENMSVGAAADNTGAPLEGRRRYLLRLPARMPVEGFWSLSAYSVQPDGRKFFSDNPLHRVSIGDRTPGLRRNKDGSLDILIQRDPPPPEWRSNWLPIPDGPFSIGLRNYQPRKELLDGAFRYPAIKRLD